MFLYSDIQTHNHALFTRRLVIPMRATTGANGFTSDLGSVVFFKTQDAPTGADSDTGNGLASQAAGTANGTFGVLISGVGLVREVLLVRAYTLASGVFTPVSIPLTLRGTSTTGVTASGNIAFDVDSATQPFSSTPQFLVLEVEFKLQE